MSSPADLTARARIRDAAITLFAERGIAGASIREIAQAAGVSSGLLRHHFGSKEGLRDACDDFVLAELARVRAPAIENGQAFAHALDAVPLRLQDYVVRSTMDASPTGTAVFERMVEEGEHWLANSATVKATDPRAFAAVLVAMKLGMHLMRDRISGVIGDDTRAVAGQARMFKAAIEIFSQPLLSPELAEDGLAALDRMVTTEE
ncbi:TetR/AcrR family transcriptional regulator [Actinoplanes sp. NPDC051494]|uniref:TetR/AcrR family transcriptional regulator n=1 Tax=Actinoplanes sp. NPDC051494 TaxID=3363907 RepID=UPI0037B55E43